MAKLLRANLERLRKDRFVSCLFILVFFCSLLFTWMCIDSFQQLTKEGYVRTLDNYYFEMYPYFGAFYGVFVSFFLGIEYSNGCIRNKLVVGHTRTSIFLANFSTCAIGCLLLFGIWFLGSIPCFFFMGPLSIGFTGLLLYIAVALVCAVAFAALYTAISSLVSNTPLSVILCLGLWLAISLTVSALYDRLSCPEMSGGVHMVFIDGVAQFIQEEPKPNPLYLTGWIRTVCEMLLDFLPEGPAVLAQALEIEHPFREMGLGLLFAAVSIFSGSAAFRRKNIQ